MSETARSVAFVTVAVVSAGIAWFAKPPDNITPADMQSAKLGKPFFPDFEDPNAATSIRVVSFDEKQAVSRVFAVEQKDGLWRIPSRHNYPADGAERLAKTSTSLMGVVREEFMPGGETRHEEFGVLDPMEADSTKLKGRGQRVTLTKGDSTLLDLIIGKPVRERPGHRYLRRPDEKSVYVAKINPDLSTKFADWVETNLLKVSRDELASMEIDNYSIAEGDDGLGRIVPGEVVQLKREKSGDPWKLEGLDDPTKEVDTTKTNDMVSTLADLKLTGIRPKPPGLNVDLTIDRNVVKQRAQLDLLVSDMASKGFVPGPGKTDDDPARLYSKQGEMRLTTTKGLAYTLRFGDVFTGSEAEIESGLSGDKPKEEEKKEDEAAEKETPKSSRYLLVSVAFDESLLGPKPEKPERPAALDEKEESASAKKPSADRLISSSESPKFDPCGQEAQENEPPATPETDAKDPSAPAGDEKPAVTGEGDEPKEAEGAKPAEAAGEAPPPENKPDPVKTKEELERDYKAKLSKYEADLGDWESKAKAGQEKADELNLRFKEWYYVISADNVAKLRLTREELIREKKTDNNAGPAGSPFGPGAGNPGGLPLGFPGGAAGGDKAEPADDEVMEEDTTKPADDSESETEPESGKPESDPATDVPQETKSSDEDPGAEVEAKPAAPALPE